MIDVTKLIYYEKWNFHTIHLFVHNYKACLIIIFHKFQIVSRRFGEEFMHIFIEGNDSLREIYFELAQIGIQLFTALLWFISSQI